MGGSRSGSMSLVRNWLTAGRIQSWHTQWACRLAHQLAACCHTLASSARRNTGRVQAQLPVCLGNSRASKTLQPMRQPETTSPGPGKGEVLHGQADEAVLGQLPQVERALPHPGRVEIPSVHAGHREGLQAPQAQPTGRSQGSQDWAKPYVQGCRNVNF